ncbi:hypothetical protein F4811DRAFT_124956 [Daldinia bambusicola]|nr:hypothetical protein F4811DRAFT_124956 [Daldinia bambusicola]
MEYNVNSLNLYNPHPSMNDSTLSEIHMELGTQSVDILGHFQLENIQPDSLQHVRWDITTPGVVGVNERVYSQRGPFSNTSAESCGLDADFGHRHSSLHVDLTPESPGSQRAIQPSHAIIERRSGNIEDRYDGQETHLLQQGKRKCSQSKSSSPPSSGYSYFTIGEAQKVEKLEKNRVAASKCRKKKKKETNNLQVRAKALTAERNVLKSMADALREEVIELKNEILKHGMCDCHVIQNYITESARQIA